jgi:maltokinase
VTDGLKVSGREGRIAGLLHDDAWRKALEGQLPTYLPGLRWFGGQTRELVAVRLERWVDLETDEDACLCVVAAQDAGGKTTEHQLYLETAGFQDGERMLRDALESGPIRAAILELCLKGAHRDGHELVLRGDPVAGAEPASGCAGEGKLLGAEQSNSSVIYGEACILKVYRRLEAGPNPDTEMVRFLAAEAKFPAIPALVATALLEGPGRFSSDAITVQQFVPNQGDGWGWALERAEAAVRETRHEGDVSAWLRREGSTLAGARALGRITAQLHAALATADAPGMTPVRAKEEDLTSWLEDTREEAAHTLAVVRRAESPAIRAEAIERVSKMPPLAGLELGLKMRIHGDYHLGQVLRSGESFIILDFEGEPSRPIAERRALQHPLNDVAGMVRSWSYVAATAGRSAGGGAEPLAAAWLQVVREAFVTAYWEEAAGAPSAFVPADRNSRDRLLALFELRKALYEVQYELNNRPDWVGIPAGALDEIYGRLTAP